MAAPAANCLLDMKNATPPPGTRCEGDSECDRYKCTEGLQPGCLVKAMGGSRAGTCQCVPKEAAASSSATPAPPKKTASPPPARRYCDSRSDCAIWTCRDGSKPLCDTRASGDPFTKYCRCG
ncbi:hypothetical protein JDV02_005787 [Purpureocillium takamizusanense]|uniref:Uncharacterized protein n=1 Tax=Purpureocillium takamizusanense TaxID=2060973 RepID=A0A9Q8VBF2_9HYPO|nr:uncharacterized protein JDV02_005787 [Purpureocillium takamizusanense]UNI19608.1 hypothetical protein JDV02_005787 [Purpureocillium takamizusanense]